MRRLCKVHDRNNLYVIKNNLLTLVVFTVVLGIYPAPILDGLHYSVSSLIYYASAL